MSDMRILVIIIFIYFTITGCMQNSESTNQRYDAELAKKLSADEYGMKKFVLAFLKSGTNRNQDSTETANIQRAHLDNIRRLADKGKLVLAGPFLDNGEIRGIYIFNVPTIQEAEALTNSDPAIQTGRLIMELHPWYGSAAILEINDLHKRISLISH